MTVEFVLTRAGVRDVLGGPLATSPLTFVTVAENSTIGHAPDEEAWAPGADGNGCAILHGARVPEKRRGKRTVFAARENGYAPPAAATAAGT